MFHLNSTSNHNNRLCPVSFGEVVFHLNSTSNHNNSLILFLISLVVFHLNSTSNHNFAENFPIADTVVFHLNSTSNHNTHSSRLPRAIMPDSITAVFPVRTSNPVSPNTTILATSARSTTIPQNPLSSSRRPSCNYFWPSVTSNTSTTRRLHRPHTRLLSAPTSHNAAFPAQTHSLQATEFRLQTLQATTTS